MDTGDIVRLQSLFGDRLPQSQLVGTMKRLLAYVVLCTSLSASAQDDNCTVLGVQELSAAYYDLNASINSITDSIDSLASTLSSIISDLNMSETAGASLITQYEQVKVRDTQHTHYYVHASGCQGQAATDQVYFNPAVDTVMNRIANGWAIFNQEVVAEKHQQSGWFYGCPGGGGSWQNYKYVELQYTFVKYADD
jgi:hypothetical protein